MKNLRNAYSLMIMAAMFEGFGGTNPNGGGNTLTPEKINVKPKEKIIPKGCKVYSIEIDGQYYDVIGLNEKSARKKLLKQLQSKKHG